MGLSMLGESLCGICQLKVDVNTRLRQNPQVPPPPPQMKPLNETLLTNGFRAKIPIMKFIEHNI